MTRPLFLITALGLAATLAPLVLQAQATAAVPSPSFPAGIPALPLNAPLPEPVVYVPVTLAGTPEQITSQALAVLGRTDWSGRLAGIADILRQLTSENSGPVRQAFLQDKQLGRSHEFEWRMLNLRLGQVNGPRFLGEYLPETSTQDLNETASAQVEGWASRQPKEATEWFNAYPRWRSRNWLALAISRGLTAHSLETAEAFLDTADGEVRAEGLNILFLRMASAKGLPTAIAWAEKKLASPTPSPSASGEDWARRTLLKRMLEPICATYDREALQAFLARHSLATYFTVNEANKIMRQLAWTDPVKVIEWMATVELAKGEEDQPLAIWGFADIWFKNDEPGILTWIEKSKEHPHRDFIVWSTGLALASRGQLEEGRKLMATMKVEINRTRALGELESRYAPKELSVPTQPAGPTIR